MQRNAFLCAWVLCLVVLFSLGLLVGCTDSTNDEANRQGDSLASDDGPNITSTDDDEMPSSVNGPNGWPIDALIMDNGQIAVLYSAAPSDRLAINGVAIFDAHLNHVDTIDLALDFPHTLDAHGTTLLISDSGNERLVVVDTVSGDAHEIAFDQWEASVWPNDADFTADGNIIFSDIYNAEIYKITPDGEILWSRSMLDVFGDYEYGMDIELHDPDELPNGNLLFCLSAIGVVCEIDADNNIVWSYGGLNVPKSAQRLANGNTLIGTLDTALEVTPAGDVVWQFDLEFGGGMNTERYADGNTMLGTTHVRLIAPDGSVVWEILSSTEKSKAADDPNHRQMLLLRSIGYL